METIRKVLSKLVIFTCFMMIVTTPGCDSKSSEMLLSVGERDAAPQECCYLSYKVNSVSSYSEKISRKAAVKVQIEYPDALIRGSGTYFKYKGHNIVITAAHLFALGPATTLKSEAIITTPHEKTIGTLVYIDRYVDIAIFKVTTLDSRTPAKFKRTPAYEVGENVVYSGFPGANNLLTIPGTISGEGFGTDIAIHSFAWGGSSGSGVFDESGKFVGVVVAMMVGRGFYGPQLVGSVVYVAPANLIDTVYLRQNLDKLGVTMNDGF